MPRIAASALEAFGRELLRAAGALESEAEVVARHCVGANLAGHDSHGVINIPLYIERMKRGHIVPGAEFGIVEESATTTVIDGHWGFGFSVSERAMGLSIEKARRHRVAATTVRRQGHIGRLADYPLMAAQADMIALVTADSGRSPKSVAPFGGREARLGTNPICIAMPSNLEGPFFIDMSTAAAAGGKLDVAAARGQRVPEGWVIDADGNLSTDPLAVAQGGALLPLGGSEGHKGYGLAAMVEIFSGILTGLGFGVEPSGRHNDGVFMAVFDVAAFRPIEEFKAEVTEFAEYLRSTPTMAGVERVYYPGEIEHLRATKNRREGIEIAPATWGRLTALAGELGVEVPVSSRLRLA